MLFMRKLTERWNKSFMKNLYENLIERIKEEKSQKKMNINDKKYTKTLNAF